MQHTPGPWKCVGTLGPQSNPSIRGPEVIEDTRGQRLANIAGLWKTPQSEANGRLMAAAPDLLDALNTMLTHMGMDEDEWNKPTFDKARAAIAKATGEQ